MQESTVNSCQNASIRSGPSDTALFYWQPKKAKRTHEQARAWSTHGTTAPKTAQNIFRHHNEPSPGSNAAVSDTFHPVPGDLLERESTPSSRRQWQQNATPTSPTLRSHSVSVSVEHCYAARASFLRFSDPVRGACDPIPSVTRRLLGRAVCSVRVVWAEAMRFLLLGLTKEDSKVRWELLVASVGSRNPPFFRRICDLCCSLISLGLQVVSLCWWRTKNGLVYF